VPDPNVKKAQDAIAAAKASYKIAAGMYAGASGGLAGILLGGLVAGGVFEFTIDLPSPTDMAKKTYADLVERTGAMYAGIAADPPDFAYDEPVVADVEAFTA